MFSDLIICTIKLSYFDVLLEQKIFSVESHYCFHPLSPVHLNMPPPPPTCEKVGSSIKKLLHNFFLLIMITHLYVLMAALEIMQDQIQWSFSPCCLWLTLVYIVIPWTAVCWHLIYGSCWTSPSSPPALPRLACQTAAVYVHEMRSCGNDNERKFV